MPTLTGSCACSAVTFTSTILPSASDTVACYCVTCRKISGAPFMPFLTVKTADVNWNTTDPKAFKLLRSDIAVRTSCAECGSQLYMTYLHSPEKTSLLLGSINEDSVQGGLPAPGVHIFVSQKPGWYEISGGEMQCERFEEGYQERIDGWLDGQNKSSS